MSAGQPAQAPKEETKGAPKGEKKGIFSSIFGGGSKGDKSATKTKSKKMSTKKGGYVPPPPKEGAKIDAPSGMKKVKTFPVSSGKCPAPLEIPGVQQGAAGGDESSEEETKGPAA